MMIYTLSMKKMTTDEDLYGPRWTMDDLQPAVAVTDELLWIPFVSVPGRVIQLEPPTCEPRRFGGRGAWCSGVRVGAGRSFLELLFLGGRGETGGLLVLFADFLLEFHGL